MPRAPIKTLSFLSLAKRTTGVSRHIRWWMVREKEKGLPGPSPLLQESLSHCYKRFLWEFRMHPATIPCKMPSIENKLCIYR